MPRSSRSRASAMGIAKSAKGQARATAASTRKAAAKKVTSTTGINTRTRKPAKKASASTRASVAKRFYRE